MYVVVVVVSLLLLLLLVLIDSVANSLLSLSICDRSTPPLLCSSRQSVSLSKLQDAFGGKDYALLACDEVDGKAYLNSVCLEPAEHSASTYYYLSVRLVLAAPD
jgi:hypothetical protein